MIVWENVHKAFKRAAGDRVTVFEDINLVIPPKESIAVMGAKLAGKTTFIRMLTGFEQPDKGSITRYCEVSYPVGYSGVLASNMTGRENVAFIARVFNCDPSEIAEFVEQQSELGPALDRLVAIYAQDEKSRLAFTLSYAIPFDVYIFDGYVGRGPEPFRKKCAALLEARAQTSGIVLATANPQLAKLYCKKVLMIDDGQVTLYDDVDAGIAHFKDAKARQNW